MIAIATLAALGHAIQTAEHLAIVALAWLCGSLLAAPLIVMALRRSEPRPPRRRPLLVQVDPGELARALADDEDTDTWTVPADLRDGGNEESG